MNKKESPQNASEILQHLYGFAEEDWQEIQLMPLEEIKRELAEEGIDVAKMVAEPSKMFKKIKSKELLNRASEIRKQLLARFKGQVDSLSYDSQAGRDHLINRIKEVFNIPEEKVLTYCRKFKDASEADLVSMLADLTMLENISKELDENRRDK